MHKICIIGVGLIGGSFALALKKSRPNLQIIGFGRNKSRLETAQQLGAIDAFSLDISTALNGADLVLIATPVNSIEEVLKLIKPHLLPTAIVSDVGSTKVSVATIAADILGDFAANFVPAHPIAGKEKSGVAAADSRLFAQKRVILTPSKITNKNAVAQVRDLWTATGAVVETMPAQKHDELLAMTSHLPHILAFGLMDYLMENNPEACDYAAGGFKDFSRIAASDAKMWRDICLHNSDKILTNIEGYQRTLDKIAGLIKNNQAVALADVFSAAKSARDAWGDKQSND